LKKGKKSCCKISATDNSPQREGAPGPNPGPPEEEVGLPPGPRDCTTNGPPSRGKITLLPERGAKGARLCPTPRPPQPSPVPRCRQRQGQGQASVRAPPAAPAPFLPPAAGAERDGLLVHAATAPGPRSPPVPLRSAWGVARHRGHVQLPPLLLAAGGHGSRKRPSCSFARAELPFHTQRSVSAEPGIFLLLLPARQPGAAPSSARAGGHGSEPQRWSFTGPLCPGSGCCGPCDASTVPRYQSDPFCAPENSRAWPGDGAGGDEGPSAAMPAASSPGRGRR